MSIIPGHIRRGGSLGCHGPGAAWLPVLSKVTTNNVAAVKIVYFMVCGIFGVLFSLLLTDGGERSERLTESAGRAH